MSTPTYYRGVFRWRGVLMVLAIAGALICAVILERQWVRAIRADAVAHARAAESAFVLSLNTLAIGAWRRERDSLRVVVATRDSALTVSRELAQAARARLRYALAHPDSTPPETLRVRADAVVNACTVESDDCALFRTHATRLLVVADSQHVADSLALRSAASVAVSLRDTLDTRTALLAHSVSRTALWQNRAQWGAYGTLLGLLTCLVFCE